MDLFKIIKSRDEGFISPQKFSTNMQYELLKRVHRCISKPIEQNKFSTYSVDFSLNNNNLLVAHGNLTVSLFDVKIPMSSGYRCLNTWTIQSIVRNGLESINWNGRDMFTFSANAQHLCCVDVETMKEVERIQVEGAQRIYEHKPCPHKPEIVAVASPLAKIVLLDLRSGNASYTSQFHHRGVMAVSWSGLNDNLLGTVGDNGSMLWDLRYLKKPMYVNGDNCGKDQVLPSYEIVPFSDKLVLLNSDRTMTIWDANRLRKIAYFGPFTRLPINNRIRYKFSLSGTSEPCLLFIPENRDIGVYDFHSLDFVGSLQLGHIMPVHALCFNNYRDQLFSSSLDGSLAWVPKPLLSAEQ